jgi:cation:H+ antiporter
VLVVLDAAAGPERPLSYLVGSLTPVIEALIVVVCLATCWPAPPSRHRPALGLSPTSIAVVVLWIGGVWIVNRVQMRNDWTIEMPGARPGRRHVREAQPQERRPFVKSSTWFVALVFALAAGVTLGAGVALQSSGSELADRLGLQTSGSAAPGC